MTLRQPLVVVSGSMRELPAGDTIPGGADTDGRTARVPSPQPAVNDWVIQPAVTIAGFQPSNGELRLGWMFLPAGTYDAVAFDVANAGTTGALIKVVGYADNNGRPGTLALDSATTAGTNTSVRTITGLSLVAPAGGLAMWVGAVTQGAPSTTVNFWGVSRSPEQTVQIATPTFLWANTSPAFVVTGVTGTAPSTPTYTQSDSHVRLAFRRSA